MTITELVTLPAVLLSREETIAAQLEQLHNVIKVPGFQSGLYGFQLEDPKMLHWFLNWDTLEAHQTFIAAPEYGPFVENILKFSGPPQLWHSELSLLDVLHAPVTEWCTVYLKADADREAWAKKLDVLEEVVARTAAGYKGMAKGWIVENERAMTILVGWESREAHQEWKSTCDEAGKALTEVFRTKEVEKVTMFHVKVEGEVKA